MKLKSVGYFFIIMLTCVLAACTKTGFNTGSNVIVITSTDTLHFDTVFPGTGSITQSFKIFNLNDQKIKISQIKLAGGSGSPFHLNVNGNEGTGFSDLEMAANDSMYVFVNIDAINSGAELPFYLQDSVLIDYNGNHLNVQLDAYSQDVYVLKNALINIDTTWTSNLPILLYGNITVTAGKTLSIQEGAHIYCHADAAIHVDGSLQINGSANDPVIFRQDRLDDYYRDLPGSWVGIEFAANAYSNRLSYVHLLNAKNAITVLQPSVNNKPKLSLAGCIISNASEAGIKAYYSSINAENCLVANNVQDLVLKAGGNYSFTHCTMATYSNNFITHNNPAVFITDADDAGQTFPLIASFINDIIYGDDGILSDDLVTQRTGNLSFDIQYTNTLYRATNTPAGNFTDCIQNQDPVFLTTDYFNNIFDFHLQDGSPCINTGIATSVTTDIGGAARDSQPDLGCYEFQP